MKHARILSFLSGPQGNAYVYEGPHWGSGKHDAKRYDPLGTDTHTSLRMFTAGA